MTPEILMEKETTVMDDTSNGRYMIRRGMFDDAEAIAALFGHVYRQTSHPFSNLPSVRENLSKQTDYWLLAIASGQVVACTAIILHRWNHVYETCSSVTHPDWQTSGIGRQLLIRANEWMLAQPDCDLTYGVPRRLAMHHLFVKRFGFLYVLVGHDGAMDYATGQLEYHGLALMHRPGHQVLRVLPSGLPASFAQVVDEHINVPLAFDGACDKYPDDWVVGPEDAAALTVEHTNRKVRFRLSGDDLGNVMHLDGVVANTSSQEIADYVTKVMQSNGTVRFAHAYVLADKIDFVRQLRLRGFVLSAYLPGWYLKDGHRYDCMLLTWRNPTQTPLINTNGFDPLITQVADWDQLLA